MTETKTNKGLRCCICGQWFFPEESIGKEIIYCCKHCNEPRYSTQQGRVESGLEGDGPYIVRGIEIIGVKE